VVAAIGLAVGGGGLYLAAGAANAIVLVILAGIKPLEDKYKDKRYSCVLYIKATHGKMTLDILQKTMGERVSRIKQFVVQQNDETPEFDDVSLAISRIPHKDVLEIMAKLRHVPV